MLPLLKRHPLPVAAHFKFCLVLTYALPEELLAPLLPPGLTVDSWNGLGFVAVALVQTEKLRPAFLPAFLGRNFFLSGYRIFARYTTPDGKHLRGLRILQSETNSGLMAFSGNLLTHYNYKRATVTVKEDAQCVSVRVARNGQDTLCLSADKGAMPAPLPPSSPFADMKEARRFAGPMPFTFDYEKQTHSVIRIQGRRENWNPQPIAVDVQTLKFFDAPEFCGVAPRLANAFYIENIPYLWERGIRASLPKEIL